MVDLSEGSDEVAVFGPKVIDYLPDERESVVIGLHVEGDEEDFIPSGPTNKFWSRRSSVCSRCSILPATMLIRATSPFLSIAVVVVCG